MEPQLPDSLARRAGPAGPGWIVSLSVRMACAGSSEALLSGVKPPFRLLVRAINPDGSPAMHIRFAVSEAFVVRPRACWALLHW